MAKVRTATRRIGGKRRKVLIIKSGKTTRVRVQGYDNTTDRTARKRGIKTRRPGVTNNPDFKVRKGKKITSRKNSRRRQPRGFF